MNLLLIRHASAENISCSGKDFDRELTIKGINQVELLRDYLLDIEFSNFHIYVSSSKRTYTTAKMVLPISIRNSMNLLDNLYLATDQDLLKFINQLNTSKDIVIFGHNDGISSLASYLTGQYIGLNTASCVTITFQCENSNEISGLCGTIVSMFIPD